MNIRPAFADNFYAGDIEKQIEEFITDYEPPSEISSVTAGVVPHAGWFYSGRVAAHVFVSIKKYLHPDTIILFGTVHNIRYVKKSSVYGKGAWQTPLGKVFVDDDTAARILEGAQGSIIENPAAHDGEHSIEVQVPFVKFFFPEAKIIPIAVMPDNDAAEIGEIVAETVERIEKNIVVVGTTDLTHYGSNYGFMPEGSGEKARKWMYKNDGSIIDLALNLDAEAILEEARNNHNACGPGALAASAAFAKKLGVKKGRLLDYTTSFDVMPDREFTMGVGYAGILY